MQQEILSLYHQAFREQVLDANRKILGQDDRLLHLSVHSFTPILNGQTRNADIGILYDPQHGQERAWAIALKISLAEAFPSFAIRFNYPYLGKSDGHTKALRRMLGPKHYAGLELELNQKHVQSPQAFKSLCQKFSLAVLSASHPKL